MKREVVYLSVGLVGLAVYGWAVQSGGGTAMSLPYVSLQGGTPGSAQTGHINVSGTIIGGQHVGGGAGLTSVNADLLDGLNSSAFLQSVPLPLFMEGTITDGPIIQGLNHATAGWGVRGYATAATGNTYGGIFVSWSPTGRGAHGAAMATTGFTFGVLGRSLSSSGSGVFGEATAATGITYGVYGQSASTGGRGVYGSAVAATGNTNGVYGRSNSTTGRGVFGEAISLTGTTYGGRFESDSTNGIGVYGQATATTGTIFGVYGQASTSAAGYAVYAAGDLGASGTKTFRIDHPFDPENKYLLHYASESPMPQNFYVGNAVTDAKGYAWVELPDYFAEINANFKYQLTVVDDTDSDGFVMAKISKEIRGSRFQVRTSAPNVKVSWEVKADRNDLYVRHKKPKDVTEKEGPERGTYQHPELYGEPEERGMNYRPKEKDIQPPSAPRRR